MAATTAYSTSNTAFHPHSFTPPRVQYSPVSLRTTPSSSNSHLDRLSISRTIKNDENNNEQMIDDIPDSPPDHNVLYIAIDNEIDDSESTDSIVNNDVDEEQFLSFVGLRRKNYKPVVTPMTLLPVTKRFACPICLLPLPKYTQRVRQALYIRLPFLKFLRITHDIERFCSTDANARAQSLLPRSTALTRSSTVKHRSPKKRKLAKTEFVSMAASACRPNSSKIVINKYVQSALRCNVILDRLEQSAIDQIMQNANGNDDDNNENVSSSLLTTHETLHKTSPNNHHSLKISPNQASKTTVSTTTTTTVERTIVKRKSTTTTTTTTDMNKPKRFKSVESYSSVSNNIGNKNDLPSSTYARIYLKCFVCSKRQHVDVPAIDSDVLHSHWLEHDGDLSLNIYDSEIDSILTRVVEFFNLPRQHLLEGKIKTVFIYNSNEVRSTSTTTLSSNDSFIVID